MGSAQTLAVEQLLTCISGVLRAVWALDREEKEEYHLTITAEDMGQVHYF